MPHTLVQFGGTLAQDDVASTTMNEIWSCSIRAGDPGGTHGPHADPAGMLNALYPALDLWFKDGALGLSGRAWLTYVKVNNIGSDGHYSGGATNVHTYGTPSHGNSAGAASVYPSFVTLAATYLTDKPRGRASRGRINLPMALKGAATASSIADPTAKTLTAKAAMALVTVVETAGTFAAHDIQCRVYSSVDGTYSRIASVRVGQRFDTINRRKNAVPEAPYATSARIIYP